MEANAVQAEQTKPESPADQKKSPEKEQTNETDFAALAKINPDLVGWLSSADQKIDYPVVQGKDNEFYLKHMFTGEQNKLGTIFMDYRNEKDFSAKNTIIYGHNMQDGSMFSSLIKYQQQEYYEKFPSLVLATPAGNYKLELFAGFIVDGSYPAVRLDFQNDNGFSSYIAELKKRSDFQSEVQVAAAERIITLATCSYEFDNARYTVYGKLTPLS